MDAPDEIAGQTPTMNTTELIAKIAQAHGVSKAQAKSIVEDIFKDIVDFAASGAEVSLSGFGKFKVKVTPEREGRNPASGEKDQDRGVKEARLLDCQIGQRHSERLSRTVVPIGGPTSRVSTPSLRSGDVTLLAAEHAARVAQIF